MPVKVIAKTGVGIRLYEAVTISAKGDLRWTKVREGGWRRKYGETDWAFSSNHVYCWVMINMKHLSALWYEDNNPTEIQKKKKRGQWGRRPSHLLHTWMAQKCWPLSGCQNPFLKKWPFCLTAAVLYRPGHILVSSVCLFHPLYYFFIVVYWYGW